MKSRTLVLAVAVALASPLAHAFHCPQDMKAIDSAMSKAKLSPERMAEVKKYRAEGEALHKAGKHQESVDTLAKAMKILGI
jgi:DNA-binding IclR family transcriptional regulator